ncbi:hypothetical protein SISNIDRAFT_546260 [Sistotremastrum niveocremeum HHB9708]|uniref:SHSP domain-containing protein n=1 Tax=Sistotremastrum niveocremeum HHB9708 TaxID=1314777 RepID=A0A164ZZI8_9AGAM|nr:hypothetical protein SISNIDRAFT_546260 [Sistotremastrum niveocremeum HHB9708]
MQGNGTLPAVDDEVDTPPLSSASSASTSSTSSTTSIADDRAQFPGPENSQEGHFDGNLSGKPRSGQSDAHRSQSAQLNMSFPDQDLSPFSDDDPASPPSPLPSQPHPPRPLHPARELSFSKRHASFDTPREVPLPYPYPGQYPFPTIPPAASASSSSSAHHQQQPAPPELSNPAEHSNQLEHSNPPLHRGYSDESALTVNEEPVIEKPPSFPTLQAPVPLRPNLNTQTSSTTSLPLPSQTPLKSISSMPPYPQSHLPRNGFGPTSNRRDFDWDSVRIPPPEPSPPPSIRPLSPPKSRSPRPQPSKSISHPPPARPRHPASNQLEATLSSRTMEGRLSGSSGSSGSSIPPPSPPTVHTPSPPPVSSSQEKPKATHNSFLSHDSSPQDTYIVVETAEKEYVLVVRLPGYNRDSIWEVGGGHFERRISFGYDADLTQVRAEFDGVFLRISVPRKSQFVSWHGPTPTHGATSATPTQKIA